MDTIQLIQEIEKCNLEVAKINNKTAKDIGRKEEIEKQVNIGLTNYFNKYGVKLDINNKDAIMHEFAAVKEEKEKAIEKMKEVLMLVDQGRYTEVNALLGISNMEKKEEKLAKSNSEAFTIPQTESSVVIEEKDNENIEKNSQSKEVKQYGELNQEESSQEETEQEELDFDDSLFKKPEEPETPEIQNNNLADFNFSFSFDSENKTAEVKNDVDGDKVEKEKNNSEEFNFSFDSPESFEIPDFGSMIKGTVFDTNNRG